MLQCYKFMAEVVVIYDKQQFCSAALLIVISVSSYTCSPLNLVSSYNSVCPQFTHFMQLLALSSVSSYNSPHPQLTFIQLLALSLLTSYNCSPSAQFLQNNSTRSQLTYFIQLLTLSSISSYSSACPRLNFFLQLCLPSAQFLHK